MEDIINEKIKEWASQKSWFIAAIALSWVITIVSIMSKHFKTIVEAMPSIRKFFSYAQKRWFSQAIFRSDVLAKLEVLQLQNNEIRSEVRMNGGKYKLVDAIEDLQRGQKRQMDEILHLKGLRDISDRFDSVMRFRYHPERGCTLINEAFLKGFGHYEGRVLGFNFEELVHVDDVEDMRLKWNQACNNLTEFRDGQKIRDSLGVYHSCELMAKPILDSEGILIEYSGVIEIIYQ